MQLQRFLAGQFGSLLPNWNCLRQLRQCGNSQIGIHFTDTKQQVAAMLFGKPLCIILPASDKMYSAALQG